MTRDDIEFLVKSARLAGVHSIEYQDRGEVLRVEFSAGGLPEEEAHTAPSKLSNRHELSKDQFIRSPQMGRFSLSHPGSEEPEEQSTQGAIIGYVTARDVVLPVVRAEIREVEPVVPDGAAVGYGQTLFRIR